MKSDRGYVYVSDAENRLTDIDHATSQGGWLQIGEYTC